MMMLSVLKILRRRCLIFLRLLPIDIPRSYFLQTVTIIGMLRWIRRTNEQDTFVRPFFRHTYVIHDLRKYKRYFHIEIAYCIGIID